MALASCHQPNILHSVPGVLEALSDSHPPFGVRHRLRLLGYDMTGWRIGSGYDLQRIYPEATPMSSVDLASA